MAGQLIMLLPKTTIDFSGLTNAVGVSAQMPIGAPIKILDFATIGIAIRVHSVSIGTSSSLSVSLVGDGYTGSLDPFAFPGPVIASANILSATFGAPPYVKFLAGDALGEYASVTIQGNCGQIGDSLQATLSMDIYLRNADES